MSNYFSLYIHLKDKILFEHLLNENKIDFKVMHSYETFASQAFKYMIAINKKKIVDKLCIEEEIEWLQP